MKLLVCAAAAVIAIGAAGWWYAPEYRGRQQVKAGLIDPDSAQFSNVTVNRDTWVVCGLVNARNRMGGYVGKTMFVAFLNDGDLRLEPPEETIGSTECRTYLAPRWSTGPASITVSLQEHSNIRSFLPCYLR